jgi:hypothetical protein
LRECKERFTVLEVSRRTYSQQSVMVGKSSNLVLERTFLA